MRSTVGGRGSHGSHHAELASLAPERQEYWLDRVVVERLSIKALRQSLSAERHGASAGRREDLPGPETLVLGSSARTTVRDALGAAEQPDIRLRGLRCPHCGRALGDEAPRPVC
jgi:hypothetical protein